MSKPLPKVKVLSRYPDETKGSKLAAEMRKRANALNPEEKSRYLGKAMALIYGGGAKEAASVGR